MADVNMRPGDKMIFESSFSAHSGTHCVVANVDHEMHRATVRLPTGAIFGWTDMDNLRPVLEVGGLYRTRGGHKARIYATDGESDQPIHGAIQYPGGHGRWHSAVWTWRGKGAAPSSLAADDIVEWWHDVHPAEEWPVDAKIRVRDHSSQDWSCRHFAKYENGMVHAWESGATSWSTVDCHTLPWVFAELVED